jgi:hypothetical protein
MRLTGLANYSQILPTQEIRNRTRGQKYRLLKRFARGSLYGSGRVITFPALLLRGYAFYLRHRYNYQRIECISCFQRFIEG